MKVHGSLQVTGTTEGITFTDGSTTFPRQPKLTFDSSNFYLGGDGAGYGKVKLKHPGLRVSGDYDFESAVRLSLSTGDFYLTKGSTGQPVVNMRFERSMDTLQLYSEGVAVGNFFIDTDAPYAYTINSASVMLQSGTATVGFYIVPEGSNKNGTSVPSLDPVAVTSTRQVIPTAATVNRGSQLKMSVTATSSGKQLRVSIRATRI